ncbi:RNA polymerase sigma factor [Reichenbachiella versicolor]|uniref:RNA polymerase sigma factor n=1 Tax=Reichenbachiella versicolor TaxID=1821036 RepID=UPI000D6E4064|nr:sigma-70 family RNA polymerase sigma factor [Reichenbachiella versicolor]
MKRDFGHIIKKCLEGNAKYQSILYDHFCQMVMGICSRYGASSSQVDDMFQDAFIKIFGNLSKVREADALPGWIKRLTVNTCLNALRLENHSWIAPLENENVEDSSYVELLDQLSNEKLIELINELPEGCRAVLNLFIMDGYNHKEIAEQLSITVGTSRSQLNYAKKLLRDRLEKLGIGRYESVI